MIEQTTAPWEVRDNGGIQTITRWEAAWPQPDAATIESHRAAAQAWWIPTYYPQAQYPSPDVTLPLMRGSNVVGKARPVVDADTLETINLIDSASPQNSWAEQQTQREANRTEYAAHTNRIALIAADLATVDAQVDGTNWTDVVLTNITTTAATWTNATQRATIIAIKDALQASKAIAGNLKTAVKNLRQATEKIRKEIK